MDTSGYNTNNSDKCPKCGAAKVFSALRCPACGTEYAAAAPNRNAAGTNAGFTSTSASNFDLNASFSAYKKSIEPQADAAAAAIGTAAAAGIAGAAGSAAAGSDSALSGIAELNKPVELDPIARKLQEMSKQNSVSTPGNTAAPMPGVYIPGASNQSSSYQASQAQASSYQSQQFQGTQSQAAPAPGVWYPGMPAQSNAGQGAQNANNAGASGQGAAPQGMRFQGRPQEAQVGGYTGAQGASPYASPYASPNYGASYGGSITEKEKPSKAGIIFKIVLVLAILGIIGYGFYKYNNPDKNENGVSYTSGSVVNGQYVNEWAELKIDLTKGISDQTALIDSPSIQSSVKSLNYQWRDRDADAQGVFLSGNEYHDGFANGMLPAVMMYVITDNSFNAKMFGAKVEDFFYEYRLTGGSFSLSLNKTSDMVLCGQTYKTFVTSLPMGDGRNITMYMCVRPIGNKLVLLYLYDIPGYYDLSTLQSYFVN